MKRRLKGLLSVLLTLMLLVNTFVIAVSAENIEPPSDSTGQNISNTEGPGEEVIPEPTVEEELVSERTETSKSFLMSDKSIRYALYDNVVHYEENGELKEIDNTLIPEGKQEEEDFNGYVNKDNSVKIKLAEDVSKDKVISMSKDQYEFALEILTPVSQTSSAAKLLNPQKDSSKTAALRTATRGAMTQEEVNQAVIESNQEKLTVNTDGSRITYHDVFPDTDLVYTLKGQDVKEDIVVKQPQDSYSYRFLLHTGVLSASLNENGAVDLFDATTNEIVFSIPRPYMYDDSGAVSHEVSYDLTPAAEEGYIFTITADAAWINRAETVFPVTIDPSVFTVQNRRNIMSCFASKKKPTYKGTDESWVVVGKSYEYGITRGYVSADLPELNRGDIVVDAKLNLCQVSIGDGYFWGSSSVVQVNAYKVTSEWQESNLCWNKKPTHEDIVLDYQPVPRNDPGWKTWNVTRIVQEWYDGVSPNHGIALCNSDENDDEYYRKNYGYVRYLSDAANNPVGSIPVFEITYRNNKGLEDYWTYQTASAGRAGVGYVSDYSGNLVFTHGDAATTGSRMPAEVSHIFNGYMANAEYSKVGPKVGRGWKLNVQQTIRSSADYNLTGESLALFPYVYEDADGTEHYFYKDGARMIDEDGLGYTLTLSGGVFRMTDEKGGVMTFNLTGNLTSIADANGNTLTVNYSGNQITGVTDGVGRSILFTIDGDGYLQKITDPSGRSLIYRYDGNQLTSIQYPDGLISNYAYDPDGALVQAYEYSGYGLKYDYTVLGRGKRVSQVWEQTKVNGTLVNGQGMTIDYTKNHCTTFRTSGKDDQLYTSDDLYTTLMFDKFGRTVSTSQKTGSQLLGAGNYSYTKGDLTDVYGNRVPSDYKRVNKVTRAASMGKNVNNFLFNHSAEMDTSWNTQSNMTGSKVGMSTAQSYMGKRSFEFIINSSFPPRNGWYWQLVKGVTPGKTYTFSAYVKVKDVQKKDPAIEGEYGASLTVISSYGWDGRLRSPHISKTDPAVNNGWQRISVTFTIPPGETEVYLGMETINATGSMWYDCLQVEEGDVASPYNLLENPSFKYKDSNEKPTGWSSLNLGPDEKCIPGGVDGDNAAKVIAGELTIVKEYYQIIPLNNPSIDDTYIFSAWAKGISVTREDHKFDLCVEIQYAPIGNNPEIYYYKVQPFNASVNEWQYNSIAFDLRHPADASRVPTRLRVFLRYQRTANSVLFDNAQLLKEEVPTYVYNDDGKLVSVVDNAKQKSSMEYTNSDLTKSVDAKGFAYTYTYDSKHNMTEAKSQNEVLTKYTYNSKGVATALKVEGRPGDSPLSIGTSATYYQEGNYVQSTTDSQGEVTHYNYDLTKGTLLSATAGGNTVNYSYNANTDALEQVAMNTQNGLVFNGYEYTNDMLSKIKHNGFEYTFQYDAFGNRLSSKVGDQLLMSQSYAASNGKLLRSDYGNGHYFQQSYDILDRMIAKTYNGQPTFEWKYDTAGTVKEHKDIPNNTKQLYDYDSLGRLVRSSMLDASSNEMLQQSEYGFDLNNNVTKRVYSIKGQTQVNEYTYGKDNLLMSTKLPNGVLVSNTIDRLNRVEKTTLELPTPKVTSYAYSAPKVSVNGSTTTTQLYKETIDGEVYEYRYDNAGNITEIWKDDVLQSRYGYDDLYQLVTEYDAAERTETRYTYDNGGNILNRYVVDAQTGRPVEDVDYGYDAQWKDKLVSYDGQPITYDPIGNPLNYLGYAMTWQRGRQLATLDGNGVTASYQYNADGMRTTKTVNGVTSKYYYAGTQLLAEERGSDLLQFYYSGGGIPVAFNLNGVVYYYQINSRGDITGIYDANGTLVVQYTYDAWGNPTGITGSMADTIGQMNPLRYRGYYYDAETGFYYLQSRYYDPEVGRFINVDNIGGMIGSLGSHNMFAYCGNNPVNREDSNGLLWKAIGGFLKKIGNAISNFAKNTFGAGSSTVVESKQKVESKLPAFFPKAFPITVTSGAKETATVSKQGNSSKPISVYSKNVNNSVKSSSVGLKANASNYSYMLNLSLDNIGSSGSVKNGDTTSSFGIRLNLAEFKVGYEITTITQIDDVTSMTSYTNYSIDIWTVLVVVFSPQSAPSQSPSQPPSPVPSPVPSF